MTNVTHKFLSMYLFLIISLYMFRGAEESIWAQEGRGNRGMEKITQ